LKKIQNVKTIDRLITILDCFSSEHPTWSLAELSQRLDMPKSSLHRFLVSLESHGILRRDRLDKRWRLGYRLFAWGCLAAENTQLIHIAKPFMQDLTKYTEETTILTAWQNHEVVCIEKVESNHPVRMTLDVGTRRLPHAGASSKILMAYLPHEEIQDIIRERGLPKLCVNTITDPDKLMAELIKIREHEYAESYQETDQGAWGVATPIRDRSRAVVAGIGVAGPISRFNKERAEQYREYCRNASLQITTLLNKGIEASMS